MTDIIEECARLGYERHPYKTADQGKWVDRPWGELHERHRHRHIEEALHTFLDAAALGALNQTGLDAIKAAEERRK